MAYAAKTLNIKINKKASVKQKLKSIHDDDDVTRPFNKDTQLQPRLISEIYK